MVALMAVCQKVGRNIPFPNACWPCFKWLTIIYGSIQIIKMEQIVRENFERG